MTVQKSEKVPDWTKPVEERNPKVCLEVIMEGHPIEIHRIIQMIRMLHYGSLKSVVFRQRRVEK